MIPNGSRSSHSKKRSKLCETLLQAAKSVETDQRALSGVRSPRIIDFHSLSRSVGTFKTYSNRSS